MTPLSYELRALLDTEPVDLARAALVIAKLEYPRLDPTTSLAALAELGDRAAVRLRPWGEASVRARITAFNQLLYEDENFAGNHDHYNDFRNSLLNLVIERRLGIPISLGVIYIEVARRAGLDVQGIAFPGHFLLRVPTGSPMPDAAGGALILDPFDGGAEVDERRCRSMLVRQLGKRARFDPRLLDPCTPRELVSRMINNLKRTYVDQRSFPQAWSATDLLLAIDPTAHAEVRDRGLLAYQLDDFPSALRDLEEYLALEPGGSDDRRDEIMEHVRTLRRRVASLN
jgi:regulator of sirC expression with transglutaminase-like and TPR domain